MFKYYSLLLLPVFFSCGNQSKTDSTIAQNADASRYKEINKHNVFALAEEAHHAAQTRLRHQMDNALMFMNTVYEMNQAGIERSIKAFPHPIKERPEFISPGLDRDWTTRNGPGTFFYDAYVDSLLKSRQKEIMAHLESGYSDYNVIKSKEIARLSAHALLYYCLAHPCSYFQNCSMGGAIPDDGLTYITRYLPSSEKGRAINDLQRKYLLHKKDSIAILLQQGLQNQDTIGIDELQLIQALDLTVLVPLLNQKADLKKNPYIYTVFYHFMRNNQTFLQSAFYKKYFATYDGFMDEIRIDEKDIHILSDFALRFYSPHQQ